MIPVKTGANPTRHQRHMVGLSVLSRGPRAPRDNRRVHRWAMLAVLALTTACDVSAAPEPDTVLPESPPAFAEDRLTWAQDDTIHHGDQILRLDRGPIVELHTSAYGFLVEVGADLGLSQWFLVNGGGSHRLPGDIGSLAVSPDGRHVGWIDWDGPSRPAGRVAQVVLADLATGRVIGRTSDGMGGDAGDDLGARYENTPPVFLGFDEDHAYYTDAENDRVTRRWDLRTERIEDLEHPPDEVYRDLPWAELTPRPNGFDSADGRYRFDPSVTGRVQVSARRDGAWHPATPDYGHRWVFLAALPSPHTLRVITRDEFEDGYDPGRPDSSTGFVTECDLRTGHCRDLLSVHGTWQIVFPELPGAWDTLPSQLV